MSEDQRANEPVSAEDLYNMIQNLIIKHEDVVTRGVQIIEKAGGSNSILLAVGNAIDNHRERIAGAIAYCIENGTESTRGGVLEQLNKGL